jgi:hypothetical protein
MRKQLLAIVLVTVAALLNSCTEVQRFATAAARPQPVVIILD